MSDANNELAVKLKAAHREFLLSRIEGDELLATIKREMGSVYQWGQDKTLNEVVDTELLITSIIRIVDGAPVTDELNSVIIKSVITGIQAEINDGTTLESLVPKEEYDNLISHYAQFEKLRADVIRIILDSPIYSTLISDVLYHGIKDYVMGENIVSKKVPGMSALMKAGAKSLNKALPKLEAAAESTIKKFISGNLRNTVELSERILNNALSDDNIKNIADHFWDAVSEKDFSKFKSYVTEEDIDRSVSLGTALWSDIRQADYLHNMIRQVVTHVMAELGDRTIYDIVNQLGYTEEYIVGELEQIMPGALGKAAVREYIELRVDANLDDFYSSPQFAAAIK